MAEEDDAAKELILRFRYRNAAIVDNFVAGADDGGAKESDLRLVRKSVVVVNADGLMGISP
jgi:hypothetical protein